MSACSDEELLIEAGRGSRDSFALLVERHHRMVVQFAYRFLGNVDGDTAEDLAQQVFLAAWTAAPSFRPRGKAVSWLLRITTNACLNYRRSMRLRATVALDPDSGSGPAADEPVARAIAREQAKRVTQALAHLPANQRAAILLRHYHDLPYSEIADALEISVSAVETLLFRARRKLRDRLAASESEILPQVLLHLRSEHT